MDRGNALEPSQESSTRTRGLAAWILGPLLLFMAVTQASDPSGFVDVLMTYQVGGRAVAWGLALALIAGEAVGGVGLLSRRIRHRRGGGDVALAVALLWSVLGVQAFARGLALESCGCFGVHLAQPLRWWVLLQDAELVALAVFSRRSARRSPRRPCGQSRSEPGSTAPRPGSPSGTRTDMTAAIAHS